MNRFKVALLCIAGASVLLGACLDPLVDDDVAPRGLVLPAGTAVPDAHDELAVDTLIADNDGVDGEVPLLSGFAGGAPVRYWDFGVVPEFAAPLFVLIRRDAAGDVSFVDHNTIMAARAAVLAEVRTGRSSRAFEQLNDICPDHQDYMWDVRFETP